MPIFHVPAFLIFAWCFAMLSMSISCVGSINEPPPFPLLLAGVASNGPTITGPDVEVIKDLGLDDEIQQELHGEDSDRKNSELGEAPATHLTIKCSKAGKVEARVTRNKTSHRYFLALLA